jgi:hypothetical protein
MNAPTILNKAGNLLRNRVLRNVVLWICLLLLAHGMNMENDKAHHYGFKNSSWYWWVFSICFVLQLILVFVNNLVLVPRLLVQRKRLAYMLCLLLHVGIVSFCFTIVMKIAAPHVDVSDLQQVNFVTSEISSSWSAASIWSETWSHFVGNLIWVFVFTMAWYMNDYSRQRKETELAKQQQSETELAFLHSQLAPHFLFNTLNNIYALTLKESSAAPEAMLKLSAILRSLLYESGNAMQPFEKEAGIIHAYTDLELLRIKDVSRMKFQVHADADYSLPPLLWLPVLENIFKHGTRIISEELFVEFSFIIKDDVLTICGRNYHKGMRNTSASEKGIGLENLQRRLNLLYPGRHTFSASHSDNIFTTEVVIKLK